MIKLLKKYGVELKLKKCDLFRLIEGQKDTFLEDGFAFKMTNATLHILSCFSYIYN